MTNKLFGNCRCRRQSSLVVSFMLIIPIPFIYFASTYLNGLHSIELRETGEPKDVIVHQLTERLKIVEEKNQQLLLQIKMQATIHTLNDNEITNKDNPAIIGNTNDGSLLKNVKQKQYGDCSSSKSKIDLCEVIHVAFVVGGYKASRDVVTLIKSLLFYRKHPIHFHFIADHTAEMVLSTIFRTWRLPNVDVTFYNMRNVKDEVAWIPNRHYSGIYGLMKLLLINILPNSLQKVIVMDTDVTFNTNVANLWYYFRYITGAKAFGLVENQSDWYLGKLFKRRNPWPALGRGFNTGVMLVNLKKLRLLTWNNLWKTITERELASLKSTHLADQDIINAVIHSYPKLVYKLPCNWNIQLSDNTLSENCYKNISDIKVIHWNSPKKINVNNKRIDYFRNIYRTFLELDGNLLRRKLLDCEKSKNGLPQLLKVDKDDECFEFRSEALIRRRIHPYFMNYNYNPKDKHDITLITQLSIDRLQMLEGLSEHWNGPISVAVYMSEHEIQKFDYYIQSSEGLSKRTDIAYHVMHKEGQRYPINALRNVALDYANTSYVFLLDIDFLPSHNSYAYLREFISKYSDMNTTALIVPAFETQRYKLEYPQSKIQLINAINNGEISIFRQQVYDKAHSPTNFSKWRTANKAYQIQWQQDFEPYIVVKRDVCRYDPRFVGFGWNKVSHIMELHAREYYFLVLPNIFIIHMPHSPSLDISQFRSSKLYRKCLKVIKEEFKSDLIQKFPSVKLS